MDLIVTVFGVVYVIFMCIFYVGVGFGMEGKIRKYYFITMASFIVVYGGAYAKTTIKTSINIKNDVVLAKSIVEETNGKYNYFITTRNFGILPASSDFFSKKTIGSAVVVKQITTSTEPLYLFPSVGVKVSANLQ